MCVCVHCLSKRQLTHPETVQSVADEDEEDEREDSDNNPKI